VSEVGGRTVTALGLSVGEHGSIEHLHALGLMLSHCRTLRVAYEAFARCAGQLLAGSSWHLHEEGATARLEIARPYPSRETARFGAECSMAMLVRVVTRLFDLDGERPHEVEFPHASPPYVAEYYRVFRCAVSFDRPRLAVVFPRHILDAERPDVELGWARAVEQALCATLEQATQRTPTADAVRVLLRYELDLRDATSGVVARHFHMSERTLRRRLSAEGVPFTRIVNELRMELATEALQQPRARVQVVAEALGFSEASAFHRAFKRWTGRTPKHYQAEYAARAVPEARV